MRIERLGLLAMLAAVLVLMLVAPTVIAQEAGADPIVGLLIGLLGAGFLAKWGTVTFAGVALLRAGASTLSKHVSDEKLGSAAPAVNWLAGNTKHAANAPPPKKKGAK